MEASRARQQLNPVAINALCGILDRLPENGRPEAISLACSAVGLFVRPTALAPKPGRARKPVSCDLTTDDLCERLIHLVELDGVLQQTIVQGVIAYLDSRLSHRADPDLFERERDNHISTVANLRAQLELPGKANDVRILEAIRCTEESLQSCAQRRRDAEEALYFLQEETAKVFTSAFWDALARQEISEPRRLSGGSDDDH